MTEDEIGAMLGAISAVDPMAPAAHPMVLSVWHGMLADVPEQVAVMAVRAHYRAETRTVQPADIVAVWRSMRREPRHVSGLVSTPPREVSAAGYERVMAGLMARRLLAANRRELAAAERTGGEVARLDPVEAREAAECEVAARRALLAVACPWEPCRAPVGQECRDHRGRPLEMAPGKVHPSRRVAAVKVDGSQAG